MVVPICEIHVFHEACFLVSTAAMITEKKAFFCSHCHIARNTNSSNTNSFFNLNYCIPQKLESNLQRLLKKLSQTCIFLNPFLRIQTLRMGSKCSKNYFLDFYHLFSYIWVDLICLACLVFLKSPAWPLWTFSAQELLKETILSSIICVLLNVDSFSRNSRKELPCSCKWMSVIKNYGELT